MNKSTVNVSKPCVKETTIWAIILFVTCVRIFAALEWNERISNVFTWKPISKPTLVYFGILTFTSSRLNHTKCSSNFCTDIEEHRFQPNTSTYKKKRKYQMRKYSFEVQMWFGCFYFSQRIAFPPFLSISASIKKNMRVCVHGNFGCWIIDQTTEMV